MTLSRRQFTQTALWSGLGAALAFSPKQSVQAQPPRGNQRIMVDTTEDFLNAIGPDRILRVRSGAFTLSDIDPTWQSPYARFEEVYDGYELVITNVENLWIKGVENTLSRILTRPRYADVLKFRDCRNVRFENLELAHTGDAGFCRGSVLAFANCEAVRIDDCILFGSGTHGIEANGLTQLNCYNSVIRDCTYGILCLQQASDLRFQNCQFFDNAGFSMIGLLNCQRIDFTHCLMYDNRVDLIQGVPPIGDDYLFNVVDSEEIIVEHCQLHHNQVTHLAPFPNAIQLFETRMADNAFGPDTLYPRDRDYQARPLCPV
ncbi:MAG: right-handed parallel beta-helix repeat-containing protein [Cyanobacteria bacterium J06607_6]